MMRHVRCSKAVLFSIFLSVAFASPAHAIIGRGGDPGINTNAIALRNWGLDNSSGSHIEIRKAWEITKGDREIVVAVIDTGIDPQHPDLKDNLWKKPGSERQEIVDGKKVNTFEYGWDFVTNQKNPVDSFGHGTHVAGIIGATAKANAGAAGVARNVSIMAIRYIVDNQSNSTTLPNSIKAIEYAIENGADIINYSGGGVSYSAAEKAAIQRALDKGILFVAAAGNNHENTDRVGSKFYPAALGMENIISVAGTDIDNQLVPSSNWGAQSVHVAAPGENIFSTLPNGKYGYLTGTSQGTAFVTGLAALLMAKNPELRGHPDQVRSVIVASVDKLETLKSKVISGGRINAYKALATVADRVSGRVKLASDSEIIPLKLPKKKKQELRGRRRVSGLR